jgi:hypothetical protein
VRRALIAGAPLTLVLLRALIDRSELAPQPRRVPTPKSTRIMIVGGALSIVVALSISVATSDGVVNTALRTTGLCGLALVPLSVLARRAMR